MARLDGLVIRDGDAETAVIAEYEATRRAAVRRGMIIGGGAIAASTIPLLLNVRHAFAQAEDDAAILEGAIELEQTAVVVYATAAESGLLDPEVEKAAKLFGDHEQEHADALIAALSELGGNAPEPPGAAEIDGLDGLASQDEVLNFAIEIENMAIVAYGDAATQLESAELIQTGAQIVANEAQHLTVLRQQLGENPVPEAFEIGKEPE